MHLTIGMPVYQDYCGVWETVQGIRMANRGAAWLHDTEIVIVDNCPDSAEGRMVKQTHANWWNGPQPDVRSIRYVEMPRPVGPANAKQRVFEEARGDVVLCLDSHVMLAPGAIEAVLKYFDDTAYFSSPDTQARPDFLTGPLLYDNCLTVSTHLTDRWRGQMWGTWATDERAYGSEPFEIGANGCGAFAMRRSQWVGFNPRFLGFGGEEWYIHEKVRRAGGRVLCHPALLWLHRFGRPHGIKYPLNGWYKTRNYVIGHTELGLPLERVYRHMVLGIDEAGQGEPERQGRGPMDEVGWRLLTADPANPPEWPPDQPRPAELGGAQAAAPAPPPPAATAPAPSAPAASGVGPGTELKKILAGLGISASASCACNARAAQMDQMGILGCLERREEIIGWLREGQTQWGWKEKLTAAAKAITTGLVFSLNWNDPFPGLVSEAIRRASLLTPSPPP